MSMNDLQGLTHAKKLIKENLETKATFLDLGNCGLSDLSELPELWKCQHLEGLNMGSYFSYKEKWIGSKNAFGLNEIGSEGAMAIAVNLAHLTSLDLRSNQIGSEGAKSIAENLGQLTSLNLWYNNIGSEGARAIAENLAHLTSLDLRSNQIGSEGARAIAENLGQLTSLDLGWNQIGSEGARAIAENLGQLTSLILVENQIGDEGAKVIGKNSKSLTFLNLGGNQIGYEGAKVIAENCKGLTFLDLSRNPIGDEGAKVIAENCKSLTSLDLGFIEIGDDGAKVIAENCKSLTYLGLGDNQIGDEGARVIGANCKSLTYLDLGGNQIGDEGAKVIGANCKSLTSLNLGGNQIGDEGARAIADSFKEITELLLMDNKISNFTPFIPIIENNPNLKLFTNFEYDELSGLNLSENKFVEPPQEIVEQGKEAILEYYRQKEISGTKLLLEAKMVLLGDGRSGKTTLTCRMMGKDLPKEADRTPGVDIIVGAYSFPVKEGDFKLNIWDFGGQDKYKPLHQFFYSESAVYVMVADSGNAMTDFADWFETAELFGKGSPLIVVLNEFRDGLGYGIFDEERWRRQFPKLIRSVHMVNLLNQKGFPPVEQEIRHLAYQLPHVRYEYPENWANIRSELERKRDENFISLQEYLRICSANNLPERHSAMVLSSVLHNIGVCLHYQNNDLLSQHLILKNEWATTAVYKILEDHEVAEVKKGFFNLSDLHRIWTDDNYQDMIPQLLALMCEFKLAYPLPQKNEFVTPVLLPHSPPQDWQFNSTDYITALVEYEFLPKALMTQFIVSRHTDIDRERTLVWRDGVVLTWPSDTKAEIRKIKSRGRDAFQILVTGLERKGLLTLIIKTFRDLHTEYKGIRMNEVVPCPCKGCQQKKNQQHYFDLENLTNRLEKSRRKVECDKSLEEVDILQMLGDLFTLERLGFWDQEEKSNEERVNQKVKTESSGKKVFISYSKSDEHYRNELEKHLSVLKRNGNISTWHDRKLLPGEKWDGKIKEEIKEADIILFLVSSDFLATDYIWDVEIKGAIERDQEYKNVFVVPIIVRPCDWTDSPLGVYNSGTEKGRAISLADDTDAAFFEVVEKLKEIIKK